MIRKKNGENRTGEFRKACASTFFIVFDTKVETIDRKSREKLRRRLVDTVVPVLVYMIIRLAKSRYSQAVTNTVQI